MSRKIDVLQQIKTEKLIAVIRTDTADEAIRKSEVIAKNGIHLLEVTYTTPDASKVIQTLALEKENHWVVGAGTVLDAQTARIAILNGAEFIVSPTFDEETAKLCNLYQIAYLPGCMTVNEMKEALQSGCDIIKLFPGEVGTPAMVKAVQGPLPQASIMPSGGVSLDNVLEWFDHGVTAVSAGGSLTKGSLEDVRSNARRFVEQVNQATNKNLQNTR